MSTTHPTDQVEAYLAEVKSRLVGIPEEECAELLDDVSVHVREVAEEHGADKLVDQLGTPAQFGDELRASAGFKAAQPPSVTERWWSALHLPALPTERITPVWERLEPAWWIVRGVIVAYAVLWIVAGVEESVIPRIGSSRLLGALVLLFAGGVSYVLGDRRPHDQNGRLKQARILGEVALVFIGIAYFSNASEPNYVYYDSSGSVQQDQCMRDSAGRAIGNLYGYDLTGKLIPQFFLTDQAGRPIDNLCPDQADGASEFGPPQTSYAHDVNGAPVYNVFPRAQQAQVGDPETGMVTGTKPVNPPAVLLPQIAPAPEASATTTTTVPATPIP